MARLGGWKGAGALLVVAVALAVTRLRAPLFLGSGRDPGGHPGSTGATMPRQAEAAPIRSAAPLERRLADQVATARASLPTGRPPVIRAEPAKADPRGEDSPLRHAPAGRAFVAGGELLAGPRKSSVSPAVRGESGARHTGGPPAPILIWDGLDPAISPRAPTSPIAGPLEPRGPDGTLHDRPSVVERRDGSPHAPALRLSLMPSRPQLSPGDRLWVEVELTGGREITSVPFHVRFDREVLEFAGAMKGPAFLGSTVRPILLASVNPRRPDDLAVGVSLIGSSGTFTGSGTLIRLEFESLHPGNSDLVLERASVRGLAGEPLAVRIETCRVKVAP